MTVPKMRRWAIVLALLSPGCGSTHQCSFDAATSHVEDGRTQLLRFLKQTGAQGRALVDGADALSPQDMAGLARQDLAFREAIPAGSSESDGFVLWYDARGWSFAVTYRSDCSTEFGWSR